MEYGCGIFVGFRLKIYRRWAVGENNKEKLFVHKIPFDFNEELIECIIEARQREYATAAWKED